MVDQPTLLVTGASGHLGRRVLELLLEANTGQIIATTRHPEQLADFAARGVDVRKADFDDAANLTTAFAGANRLLLISTDTTDAPGHRVQQHLNAVNAAKEAGVSHVVYTSLVKPEPGTPVLLAGDHWSTEQALAESEMGFTVLRENIYTEMLLSVMERAVATGVVASATGDGKVAHVTREDCARVAAAVLLSSFEGTRTLDMTGPAAYSYAELTEIIARVIGKPLIYVPLTLEALIEGMMQAGLPRAASEAYASFDTGIAQGKMDVVSDTVEELTGKPPVSVAEFLAAHFKPVQSA